MNRRAYQKEALAAIKRLRLFALLWERQAGKSTTFADIALYEMMKFRARSVIYASASLLLAQEIVLKQTQRIDMSARELLEKESKVLFASASQYVNQVEAAGMLFQTADAAKDKILTGLQLDDFTELFESQRLEFRVYHDRTIFSRTKVIAPNIATARGWTGTVLFDEVSFIREFRELMTAVLPIISTNPDFRMVMATTPPQDNDTHYSFELLAPPSGTEFTPKAEGNWYESELGIPVHRADAFDTHAAGKKIYDLKTGKEITPDEAFRQAPNKEGHRINHWLAWMLGGSAACDLLRLKTAMARGVGQCCCFIIDSDADFAAAMAWMEKHIDRMAPVGLGLDVATTTKAKSNPSVLAVTEQHGLEYVVRCFLVWKTRDPDVARERIGRVVSLVEARDGGRARALAVDATNEKYFAEDLRKEFMARLPVILVVASETVEKPGLEKPTNWKEYLGDQYVEVLNDNHLTLPPEAYVRLDHRLVIKDRGKFVCEPDADGRHGDTFDGGKLGVHALTANAGPFSYQAVRPENQVGGRIGRFNGILCRVAGLIDPRNLPYKRLGGVYTLLSQKNFIAERATGIAELLVWPSEVTGGALS